ncbi:MAG: hypothetical protein NUV93_07750 [Firmicutes bacterium]|nr:hypothetical protein [Bacillota bacterium]
MPGEVAEGEEEAFLHAGFAESGEDVVHGEAPEELGEVDELEIPVEDEVTAEFTEPEDVVVTEVPAVELEEKEEERVAERKKKKTLKTKQEARKPSKRDIQEEIEMIELEEAEGDDESFDGQD